MSSNGKGGATHGARYSDEELERIKNDLFGKIDAGSTGTIKAVNDRADSLEKMLNDEASKATARHEELKSGVAKGAGMVMNHVTNVAGPINSKLDLLVHRTKTTVGDFIIGLVLGLVAGGIGFNIMKTQNATNFGGMMLVGMACLVGAFALVMLVASAIRGLSHLEAEEAPVAQANATVNQKSTAPQAPTATAAPAPPAPPTTEKEAPEANADSAPAEKKGDPAKDGSKKKDDSADKEPESK